MGRDQFRWLGHITLRVRSSRLPGRSHPLQRPGLERQDLRWRCQVDGWGAAEVLRLIRSSRSGRNADHLAPGTEGGVACGTVPVGGQAAKAELAGKALATRDADVAVALRQFGRDDLVVRNTGHRSSSAGRCWGIYL